jgi:prenylcysteine oxidase/farnesylcysteine lyase
VCVDVDVYKETQTTLERIMLDAKIDPRLINEFMAAITRVNYGQNTSSINGLAGLIGLAGSGDDLRRIKGGNHQVRK